MRRYGRQKILTGITLNGNVEHDEKAIVEILKRAILDHQINISRMNLLESYLFNDTAIKFKEKKSRPDVNNKVSKPICYIACVRKNTYCFGKPFQFISSEAEEEKQAQIKAFNDALKVDDYKGHLTEVTLNSAWAGLGYKFVEKPNKEDLADGLFFKTITDIDPRQAFCVYQNDIRKDKVMGVIFYSVDEIESIDGIETRKTYTYYNVFTKWHRWQFKTDGVSWLTMPFLVNMENNGPTPIKAFPYAFAIIPDGGDGRVVARESLIPLIEYQRNPQRINDFELAMSLIDCANQIISSAVDKIEQNVNYVLKLRDIDVGEFDDDGKNPVFDTIVKYLEANILPIKSNEGATTQPDASVIDVPLDISQVKELLEFIKEEIYEALFLPSRNSGTGQDTGKAVQTRNGFTELEDFAGVTVNCVTNSEKEFVKIALQIAKEQDNCPFKDLKLKDIIIKDVRTNIEDLQEATQAFSTLVNANVNRQTAYEITKLVADAIDTAKIDEAYAKKLQDEADARELMKTDNLAKLKDQTQTIDTNANDNAIDTTQSE